MNIYRHRFIAKCPHNGAQILYSLEIETDEVIHVEHIVTACALLDSGFHEEIADSLVKRFNGMQTIKAHHHGVDIETQRSPEFGRLKQRVQVGKTVYEQGVDASCAISHIVSDCRAEA
jgi:hypothetical protein